uniref:G-protein coupled receptors family 1 profile domain-containing protein n=1 Tax=Romanomermis culicivorax TaxID=13658 RepID=A0A915HWK6_ROMCU
MSNNSLQGLPIPTATIVIDSINVGVCTMALFSTGIFLLLWLKYSALRQKLSFVQSTLVICDFLFAFGFTIQTSDSLRNHYINSWFTNLYCLILNIPKHLGQCLVLNFTLLLAVERFLSFRKPYWAKYLNKSQRLQIVILLTVIVPTCAFIGAEFVGVDYNAPNKSCRPSDIRINLLKPMFSAQIGIIGLLIVAIYAAIFSTIKKNAKHFEQKFNNKKEEKRRFFKNVKASRLVLILIILCILFYVIPNIILTAFTYLGYMTLGDSGLYVSLTAVCCPLFCFPVYMWKDVNVRYHLLIFMNIKTEGITVTVTPLNDFNTMRTVGKDATR